MNRPDPSERRSREAGATITEMLTVLVMIGIITGMAGPSIHALYSNSQLRAAGTTVRTLIRYARHNAIKEKNGYRIIFNDESATPANTAYVQNDAGGSFTTLPGHTYSINESVQVLGSSPTDSMNNLTINTRGECTAGSVYLKSPNGAVLTITVAPTCGIDIS